jgi:hypothetical protein
MKKPFVLILLAVLTACLAVAAYAQTGSSAKSQIRTPRSVDKRQQKAEKRYAKAQKKAERKMLKTERKNTHYGSGPANIHKPASSVTK